jgi:hypothetical protein
LQIGKYEVKRWIARTYAIAMWAVFLYIAYRKRIYFTVEGLVLSTALLAWGIAIWRRHVVAIGALCLAFAAMGLFVPVELMDPMRVFQGNPFQVTAPGFAAREIGTAIGIGASAILAATILWRARETVHHPFRETWSIEMCTAILAMAGWAILMGWLGTRYLAEVRSRERAWKRGDMAYPTPPPIKPLQQTIQPQGNGGNIDDTLVRRARR